MSITVYGIANCDTVRKARGWLDGLGLDYAFHDYKKSGIAPEKLTEWVDAIIPAGNLIVLKTPPGSANLVANALDSAGLEEVAGTLAGDDTIFVAIADGTNPIAVATMLQRRRSGA